MSIPKILHQLWIGPAPRPVTMMATWQAKHPDFEYILWTEEEFVSRGLVIPPETQAQIDRMEEINGKADIYRWEILHQYGGVFVDADSICVEPLDPLIFFHPKTVAWAAFENETERGKLIATVAMGFVPGHPLCADILSWIRTSPEATDMIPQFKAWYSVGPGVITRFLETGRYPDFTVFPSHFFLPFHFTGAVYDGHKRVYAYQEWGTTKNNYADITALELPEALRDPPADQWVSILIPAYNTPRQYVRECLESIRSQRGSRLGFEVVWVDDGSEPAVAEYMQEELRRFRRTSRFVKVRYIRHSKNMGVAESLARGLETCSHPLVARMDADDVMVAHRLLTQFEYMRSHPEVPLCGTGIRMFRDDPRGKGGRIWLQDRVFPPVQREAFLEAPVPWIMSHPSLMLRREAILALGNYRDVYETYGLTDPDGRRPILDDFDLECRVLKAHGELHNLPMVLMYYRIHPDQVTYGATTENTETHRAALGRILADLG